MLFLKYKDVGQIVSVFSVIMVYVDDFLGMHREEDYNIDEVHKAFGLG